MNLGNTINRLRKERKLTLVELSEKSRVALATLSRMENGKMTGTLESHMKICDALGLALPDLYRDICSSKKAVDIQRQRPRAAVSIHDKRSSEEALASKVSGKKMMPVLIRLSRGGRTQKDQTKNGIEKFIYVLDGKIEAGIGEERYNLGKNDSLYFESNIPHYFKNTGNQDARIISIACPPAS